MLLAAHLVILKLSQKGGSMEPLNPPVSAPDTSATSDTSSDTSTTSNTSDTSNNIFYLYSPQILDL